MSDAPPAALDWNAVRSQEGEAVGRPGALSALCLSGGGIRSAAFCLGVIQALARAGLLGRFDYLSSVSGGGYTAGWLVRRLASGRTMAELHGDLTEPKAAALAPLRRAMRFLGPAGSPLSAAIATEIVLWVRNMLVNWLVFAPALLAAATIPVLLDALVTHDPSWFALIVFGAGGAVALGSAVQAGVASLPGSRRGPDGNDEFKPGAGRPAAFRTIVLPALGWGVAATLAFAPFATWGAPSSAALWLLPVLAFAASLAGKVRGEREAAEGEPHLVEFAFAAAAASLLIRIGEQLALDAPPAWLLMLGPLWLIGCDLARITIYVLLRREMTSGDLVREWLAAVNADKLRVALPYAFLVFAALVLPGIVPGQQGGGHARLAWFVGLLSGPLAVLGGKSPLSAAAPLLARGGPGADGRLAAAMRWLPAALALVFATLLLTGAAWCDRGLIAAVVGDGSGFATFLAGCVLAALLVGGCWIAARVNVNRYSAHAIYRVRLIRSFLGSARSDPKPWQRNPDPLTDLDATDNIRMADLQASWTERRCLFPVVNVALNCAAGIDPSQTERRAIPFTITPLHAGAAGLGKDRGGAYLPTGSWASGERDLGPRDSGHGITLGSAMAISGAAVSPNMGYHSSAPVAFLMTLFDVRLGAWLPNPGAAADPRAQPMSRSGPANAYRPLFEEMAALGSPSGADVCLSDGGHFDNLGLYEMLRRRVSLALVVDAGADPDNLYVDLGRVARFASIDFGVTLDFDPVIARKDPASPVAAAATIRYPATDGFAASKGRLLYLKPFVPEKSPVELTTYNQAKRGFPHISTADQFFTEDDFESYRHLGELLCGRLFEAVATGATLAQGFDRATASLGLPA